MPGRGAADGEQQALDSTAQALDSTLQALRFNAQGGQRSGQIRPRWDEVRGYGSEPMTRRDHAEARRIQRSRHGASPPANGRNGASSNASLLASRGVNPREPGATQTRESYVGSRGDR